MPDPAPGAPEARDLVGYADRPPHAAWPGNARLALNFVLNYEEGSEYTIPEGDGRVEVGLAETVGGRVPRGRARSRLREHVRVRQPRRLLAVVMRLFAEWRLPMTVFGCALALERNPRAVAAIVAAGHDICSHGWRWVEHFRLSEAEEREHIAPSRPSRASPASVRRAGTAAMVPARTPGASSWRRVASSTISMPTTTSCPTG